MFETVLAQIGGSSVISTLPETLSGLINSVFFLVAVIISVIAYVKAKSYEAKINKAIDTGIAVGRLATMMTNKVLENKQNIKTLIDVGLQIAPQDAQQALAAKQALIDKLNKEIQATTAQINQLKPMVPGEANADTIPTLLRETDF